MTYQVGTLSPRPQDADANQALAEQGPMYGVEVTIPALASLCQGNLDPQHTGGNASVAAIEEAVAAPLPADGATLVTVRPDADALGAMAVLRLRRDGIALDAGARARITAIADADKEASGPWPGPRPLGQAEDFVGPVTAIAAVANNHTRPMEDRVTAIQQWIAVGELAGRDAIEEDLVAQARTALESLRVTVRDGVAVVVGAHRLATARGYREAPVVVATNPLFAFAGGVPHRKHTVARWNSSVVMDWDGLLHALRAAEPGWGGSRIICGSPQGEASRLTTEEVAEIAARHLPA